MDLYLIRHAHAGSRGSGHHDIYRPLSEKGQGQSEQLVTFLKDMKIQRIVSSTATRCVQTVEPLGRARKLAVIESSALWEDADLSDTFDLIDDCMKLDGAAFCSHGNIIPAIIEVLADRGMKIKGRGCEKGSVWALHHNGKSFTKARYLSRGNKIS